MECVMGKGKGVAHETKEKGGQNRSGDKLDKTVERAFWGFF